LEYVGWDGCGGAWALAGSWRLEAGSVKGEGGHVAAIWNREDSASLALGWLEQKF